MTDRLDLIHALRYYAAPVTYKNLTVHRDPPCGDFWADTADLDEFGHVARAALAKISDLLGEDFTKGLYQLDPDTDLMQKLGVDVERRYHTDPQPGDADYNPEDDLYTQCCRWDKERVMFAHIEGPLTDSCPLCYSPQKQASENTERIAYHCGTVFSPCGHYMRGFFDFGETCVYARSLYDQAQGKPSALEATQNATEALKKINPDVTGSRLYFDENRELYLRVFVRKPDGIENYDPKLPEAFLGIKIESEVNS